MEQLIRLALQFLVHIDALKDSVHQGLVFLLMLAIIEVQVFQDNAADFRIIWKWRLSGRFGR